MNKMISKFEFKVNKNAVKDIITDEDKLSDRSNEVAIVKKNKELQKIITELKHTIRDKNLVALSACQIGYLQRIICINFDDTIKTYINPIISSQSSFIVSRETNHSIPDREFILPRAGEIEIIYQNPLGKTETAKFVGASACLMQQQLALLDGVLISDIGLEIDDEFRNAPEEEQSQVIEWYLDSLDISKDEMNKIIEEDEDCQKLSKYLKFVDAVINGEVEIESVPMTEEEIEELKRQEAEALTEIDKGESEDVNS